MRVVVMVALATLGGSVSLRAQHGHAYEFGAFGSYTRYHRSFSLPNRLGGGVRLGYLFNDVAQLEAEVVFPSEYTVGVSRIKMDPLIASGSLVINLLSSDRNILYVLAGYSRLDFGTSAPYDFTDNGAHAAIGDRIFMSRNMALRFEFRGIYTPTTNSTFGTKAVTHILGTVGLSVLAPTRSRRTPAPATPPSAPAPPPPVAAPITPPLPTPPLLVQDSDDDGVPDKTDACPNTAIGAKVDVHGCALDADRDGVPDGLDRCPDTPVGAIVDAMGCSGDADHDGVQDGLDRCPNTPAGATVDATGCSSDADHDGVPDGIDRCPDSPPGALVDATGCTTDSDGDGVEDGHDKCPNTPKGTPVNGDGCPIALDSDGDGVPDNVDKCPGTPKGVPADATGCMILFQREAAPPQPGAPPRPGAPPPRPTLILRGVNFRTGSSVLTPDSYAVLNQVAASLLANRDIRIEIAGYTDNTGPIGVNLRLSQSRAAAVRAYLARKGVTPTRMLARGYGSRGPVASNTTTAGRAQNRRVELHKLP
jgi:outer membrane protein OmpA-like peptidoglycan-associated protein